MLSNQIAGFFDHQDIWNESSDILVFLDGVSHQGKGATETKNFSKNSNLDDSGISLPVFPSRTNLKLHNISVTAKMVKKVITNRVSSKAADAA